MGLLIDLHLHTRRHSACSRIDERQLIDRAVRVLDGLVITEHHYQWTREELDDLAAASAHPLPARRLRIQFARGDILIYGLEPHQVRNSARGRPRPCSKRPSAWAPPVSPRTQPAPPSLRRTHRPHALRRPGNQERQPRPERAAARRKTSPRPRRAPLPPATRTGSKTPPLRHRVRRADQSMADLQKSLRNGTFRPYNSVGKTV